MIGHICSHTVCSDYNGKIKKIDLKKVKMKLLILGGTIFLGRHLVTSALEMGHDVTLFNRGIHSPDLFPDIKTVKGNRDGGLAGLENGEWDAVIDTSGYVPRIVSQSVSFLQKRAAHYVFVSSISAYADPPYSQMDESAPLAVLPAFQNEEITGETYGPFKALCENVVRDAFVDRETIIRPGLIVGPNDPTDRFTYWPARINRSGEIAAPGNPFHPVQVIDVRDLADWIIRLIETSHTGVFNATGPEHRFLISDFLNLCCDCLDKKPDFTWLSEDFLIENNIRPFVDLPLWLPGDYKAMQEVSIKKALAAGLKLRSIEQTIIDTLRWDLTRIEGERRAGLTRLQEEELLRKWKLSKQFC